MVVAAIISLQSAAGSHTDDILQWIEVRARPAACLAAALPEELQHVSRPQLERHLALEQQFSGAHGHAATAQAALRRMVTGKALRCAP
jgi:hypothetical protein